MICIRSVLSFASGTVQVVAADSAVSFLFQNVEQSVWSHSPHTLVHICFAFFQQSVLWCMLLFE